MHVTAIIAAGGRGQRFGGARPKQLLALDGRTLLERSVEAFLAHPSIDEVVVALPPDVAQDPPAYLRRRGQAAAHGRRRRAPAGFGVERVCRRGRGERSVLDSRRGAAVCLRGSDRPHDRGRRGARRGDRRDRRERHREARAPVDGAPVESGFSRIGSRRAGDARPRDDLSRADAAGVPPRRARGGRGARAVGRRSHRRGGPGRARRLSGAPRRRRGEQHQDHDGGGPRRRRASNDARPRAPAARVSATTCIGWCRAVR